MTREIDFALVLNLHQPAGNLDELLAEDPWAAREILWAVDRIPRALWRHERRARVHLAMSGTLLETLTDPEFQSRVYGIVDCGSLLWYLQNSAVIELLGTAYYHPVLPLTPTADWAAQLGRWQGIGHRLFPGWAPGGFWPPEMGFRMELIPLIRKLGYRYVLVDSAHVQPVTPMTWPEVRYLPHLARHGGAEITVVVRDRELSDAQESGMDAGWFIHEACERTKWCAGPPLITTCTDGDNGGWFRNTSPKGNFWSVFHDDLLERVERGHASGVTPVFISEYLRRHGTFGEVTVRTGAWNTGWHDGLGFTQWTGSAVQREALARLGELSAGVHAVSAAASALDGGHLEPAVWRVLRAATSCNFYWGEAWVDRCHTDLDEAHRLLSELATARI